MNVIVISRGFPTDKDKLGLFEYDQACALADAGHNVIFLALDMRSAIHWRKWGITKFNHKNMTVYLMNFPGGRFPLTIKAALGRVAFSQSLKRILRDEEKVDICHAHFIDNGVYAAKSCKKNGIPLVITEHSSKINVDLLPAPLQKWANEAYKSASYVLAVSNAVARHIYVHTGVEAEVVPNIIDVSSFHFTDRKEHDGFNFVSTGNLISIKGFDTLIKSFAHSFSDDNSVHLTIIGDGTERTRLEALCGELGVRDRVTFTGRLPRTELQAIYEKSDAFVLTSRSETFGVAYIEAMLTGLPVIATKCGGPEDFVNDINGVLVPVDDTIALSDALINMQNNRFTYSDKSISEYVFELFAPEKVAAKITHIYKYITMTERN